jgi:hypothetical protein
MVHHKPTFVLTRRDPILNMVKNRVKDNIIETWQWTKKLQDIQDGCVLNGLASHNETTKFAHGTSSPW